MILDTLIDLLVEDIDESNPGMRFDMQAHQAVANEVIRQRLVLGFTPEHDDRHDPGTLRNVAVWYLTGDESYYPEEWEERDRTEGTYRDNLVKAAALLVAEIARLDRAGEGGDNDEIDG